MKRSSRLVALALVAWLAACLSVRVLSSEPPVLLWEATRLSRQTHWTEPLKLVGSADLDQDGFSDVVACHVDSLLLYRGGPDGLLNDPSEEPFEWLESQPGIRAISGRMSLSTARILDLDGDGDLDALVSGRFVGSPSSESEAEERLYVFQNKDGNLRRHGYISPGRKIVWISDTMDSIDGENSLFVALDSEASQSSNVVSDEAAKLLLVRLVIREGLDCAVEEELADLGSGRILLQCDIAGDGDEEIIVASRRKGITIWSVSAGLVGESFSWMPDEPQDFLELTILDRKEGQVLKALARESKGIRELSIYEDRVMQTDYLDSLPHADMLVAASLNDDTLIDLVVVDDGIWIPLEGEPAGGWVQAGVGFRPLDRDALPQPCSSAEDEVDSFIYEVGSALAVVRVGGTPKGESRTPLNGASILDVSDIDSDGDYDVLVGTTSSMQLYRNGGNGGFEMESYAELPSEVLRFPIVAARQRGSQVLALGASLGSNPDSPVASGTGELLVIEEGSIVERQLITGLTAVLDVGDLDDDGIVDAIGLTPDGVWVAWSCAEVRKYELPGIPSLLSVADLDGDGSDEAAVLSTGEFANLYFVDFRMTRQPAISSPQLSFSRSLPLAMTCLFPEIGARPQLYVASVLLEHVNEGEQLALRPAGVELGIIRSDGTSGLVALEGFPEGIFPYPLQGLGAGRILDSERSHLAVSLSTYGGVAIVDTSVPSTLTVEMMIPNTVVGPLWCYDMDGNGVSEIIGSTLGLSPLMWIYWNGGAR